MRLSDRLSLLSLVAAGWIAIAAWGALMLAFALALSGGDSCGDQPYCMTPGAAVAILVLFLPFLIWLLATAALWFCSWGLLAVAVFGSRTTFEGWKTSIEGRDAAIFALGSVGWIAAFFAADLLGPASAHVFWLALSGILFAGIAIGLLTIIWRLVSRFRSRTASGLGQGAAV